MLLSSILIGRGTSRGISNAQHSTELSGLAALAKTVAHPGG
jgi:hypothetical protein